MTAFLFNPNLPFEKQPKDWKGNPLDHQGRFLNIDRHVLPHFNDIMKWQLSPKPQREEKKKDMWKLQVIKGDDFLHAKDDMIVWLGHAAFFIRVNGVQLLIDPMLSSLPFNPRRSALPCPISSFTKLDYILLSHDHRDHCDESSLRQLARVNPHVKYLLPLRLSPVVQACTNSKNYQEAAWFQSYDTDSRIKITFLPSKHWGRRMLTDTNLRLWGAFMIEAAGKRIYFGGDTGYGSHFNMLAEKYPDIDYCIMGNGAYSPSWFMKEAHVAPEMAVKAFIETKAKHLMPMHYGTFDLSDEPYSEPERLIVEEFEKQGAQGQLLINAVGQMRYL
jgi:L-ascorbate metabolism protein UlaG (beta-lactamase superfamily)